LTEFFLAVILYFIPTFILASSPTLEAFISQVLVALVPMVSFERIYAFEGWLGQCFAIFTPFYHLFPFAIRLVMD